MSLFLLRFCWIAFPFALISYGCSFSEYEPGFPTQISTVELLPEAAYEKLLVEFMITNQLYDSQTDSATVDSAHQALFSSFGTTEEIFMATHRAFEQDPEAQMARIQRIRDEVQAEMERISDYMNEETRKRRSSQ